MDMQGGQYVRRSLEECGKERRSNDDNEYADDAGNDRQDENEEYKAWS